ncbi:hypothetical protein F1B92_05245 [Campylobacter sp. FMV-PI01]|uniref:Uncharacterized protein n=1 Tax=Campylobacter portucalensis TaxID=2608384 RepID=A0A6L5WKP7_9BACT|nr:hypothetical protein [Campylobacter portucalensis]MSN96575.1 hypothetical protein [Campylobacter portucalensis]
MANTDFGILIGLSKIKACKNYFKNYKNLQNVGDSVKHLNKVLAKIKLNNIKALKITEQIDALKSQIIEKAIGVSF